MLKIKFTIKKEKRTQKNNDKKTAEAQNGGSEAIKSI